VATFNCCQDELECTCPCHSYPNINHCMPCCSTCEICGRHYIDLKEHLKIKHPERNKDNLLKD
jgi:hypothetical protein